MREIWIIKKEKSVTVIYIFPIYKHLQTFHYKRYFILHLRKLFDNRKISSLKYQVAIKKFSTTKLLLLFLPEKMYRRIQFFFWRFTPKLSNILGSFLDVLMKTGRREAAHKTVKKFFGTHNPKSGAIKDREGTIIYEQEHIAERWKEYLEYYTIE